MQTKSIKLVALLQKSHFPSLACFASLRSGRLSRFAFFRSFASLILFFRLALSLPSLHIHYAAFVQQNRFFYNHFSNIATHAANAGAIIFVVILFFAPAYAAFPARQKKCHPQFSFLELIERSKDIHEK